MHIPGFGNFVFRPISQYLGQEGGILLPPSYHIVFNESENRGENFVACARREKLIDSKGEKKISRELESKVNELLNVKSTTLGDLGRLYISSSGKLVFESAFSAINKDGYLLPKIEVKALPVVVDVSEKKEIKARSFSDQFIKKGIIEPKQPWWKGYILPFLSIILFTFLFVLILKKVYGADNSLDIVEARAMSFTKNEDFSLHPANRETEENTIFSNARLSKHRGIFTEDNPANECIIITGAYAQEANAEAAVQLVTDLGFKPYRASFNGLTRVGVLFDCNIHEVDQYLSDVKEKVSPKAWYLNHSAIVLK